MASPELISVVIPTRNRASLIVGALESVEAQTYRPVEVVVVDDGSTDNTVAIVRRWVAQLGADSDFNVRHIETDGNGANAARNLGCEEATGDLIAFLDSDDRWRPQKLERQASRLAASPKAVGAYCGVQILDLETGETETPMPRNYPEGDLTRSLLISDVTAPTSCWTVRSSILRSVGGFDETLPARQDWDLWIRLANEGEIVVVAEVLVQEGNHKGQRIRTDPMRELAAHKTIYRKYSEARRQFPFWVTLAAKSSMFKRRGRVLFHSGQSWFKAVSWGIAAVTIWPVDFDAFAALGGMLIPRSLRRPLHRAWNRFFGAGPFAIRSH